MHNDRKQISDREEAGRKRTGSKIPKQHVEIWPVRVDNPAFHG